MTPQLVIAFAFGLAVGVGAGLLLFALLDQHMHVSDELIRGLCT